MLSIGYYCLKILPQVFGERQEFFWHHLVTIQIFIIGWILNFYRPLSLIQLNRVGAEMLLELRDLLNWSDNKRSYKILAVISILWWIESQIFYYFFIILYNVGIEFPSILKFDEKSTCMSYNIFTTLMIILFALQAKWTFVGLIYKPIESYFSRRRAEAERRGRRVKSD